MWLHRVNSKLQVSTDYQYQQSWAKIRRVTYTVEKNGNQFPFIIQLSAMQLKIASCKLQIPLLTKTIAKKKI